MKLMIQNELIQLISNRLRNQLISKIRESGFYTIIVNTTSEITSSDQVSIVLRWVCIGGEVVTIKETFLRFFHTTMSTAKWLADLVAKWQVDHGLNLCKVRW